MKKKYFVLLWLSALITGPAFSQNSSLLWEISGKGIEKPSFLYGTMHVKDKRVFQFGDSVLPSFNQCEIYAGELIFEEVDPMVMMNKIMMPGDTTLEMLMSKSDYEFVKKLAGEKLGAMAGMIDMIKPIFTSALITEISLKQDSSQSLDEYMQQIAKEKRMEVIGIESVEEQMAALDNISLKEQADILLASLKTEETGAKALDQLFEKYMEQDIDGMLKLVNDSEMPDVFNRSIILKRNYIMAGRIAKMIKAKPTFIGIGAAHLPGKEGVIELLRINGYTVRPIFSK